MTEKLQKVIRSDKFKTILLSEAYFNFVSKLLFGSKVRKPRTYNIHYIRTARRQTQ